MFCLLCIILLFACGSQVETTASFAISPREAVVGSVITFDATASGGAINSFEWNFGDGTTGSGQVVSHVYATAKVYTVTLTIKDSDGGTKTASSTADVYRAGKKLILMKSFPTGKTDPYIWVDSVYAQDMKAGTVSIVIGSDNLEHSVQTETFWMIFPSKLMEYVSHRPYDQIRDWWIDLLESDPPKYLFQIDDPDWQCFTTKRRIMIVDLKLLNIGTGIIGFEDAAGHDCRTKAKFSIDSFPEIFKIVLYKYYD